MAVLVADLAGVVVAATDTAAADAVGVALAVVLATAKTTASAPGVTSDADLLGSDL